MVVWEAVSISPAPPEETPPIVPFVCKNEEGLFRKSWSFLVSVVLVWLGSLPRNERLFAVSNADATNMS